MVGWEIRYTDDRAGLSAALEAQNIRHRASRNIIDLPPPTATRIPLAGTLLVSVENPPGLDRVNPMTGTVSPAANFASTDDVVVRNGIAYVADNGGGTMSAITLSSGTVSTLVTGINAAQGLAMRADGTFLVADEKSGDIRVAIGC